MKKIPIHIVIILFTKLSAITMATVLPEENNNKLYARL